jgi:hypothetical protein
MSRLQPRKHGPLIYGEYGKRFSDMAYFVDLTVCLFSQVCAQLQAFALPDGLG